MSQPSRPRGRGPAQRRQRGARLEPVSTLESRQLLAPVVSLFPRTATFTPFPNQPNTVNRGNITITETVGTLPSQTGATNAITANPSPAPITTVTQFTPNSSFGGDIVRIEAGPGGEFGRGVYAVSRGAGDNAGFAINRPGVVYRVDPATGKSSVFFDLNTVIPQLDPTQTSAANSLGSGSGLVNWYDITFDSEGVFDGRPSMFISSVDFNNTAKNAIYRVGSDGSFLGAFTVYSDRTLSETKLTFNPSAILVPPVEQQSFLRGLVAGTGSGAFSVANTSGATFAALFFDANQFRPGTPTSLTNGLLPTGVKQTFMFNGPQTGLTAANANYSSEVYDTFADFGVPQFPADPNAPFPATPGLSGVQGIGGDLLINLGASPNTGTNPPSTNIDLYPSISTNFRRFQDTTFDHYGYFSQGLPITALTGPRGPAVGGTAYAGSMFVADLATGLSVLVPQPGVITGSPPPVLIPVQGPGSGGLSTTTDADGNISVVTEPPGGNLGGRIIRIDEFGRVTNFAENFNTSGAYDSTSFEGSSLSITFSADGTTLYAADDDGIWQFKTSASLAGSTSGSIVGLNDLRTLGVPYDGRNSAVSIVDTGVDARNTNFRGRVSTGTATTISNSFGNDDFAAQTLGSTTGGTNNNAGSVLANPAGHGTPVAGVIAQFVPQATLNPVNVFTPFTTGGTPAGGGTGGGNNNNNSGSFTTNQVTSIDSVFSGLQYVTANPYVKDPVRPLNNDRVIAASLGFGTSETFNSEGTAYKAYPQVVISFKNQLRKFLRAGIAPIAAAGQFGATSGAISNGTTNGGGTGNNNNTDISNRGATNNAEDPNVGDVNGMSLPAILNETISVTGSYPFLFSPSAVTPPTDLPNANGSITGRLPGPVLVFGNTINTPGANVTTAGTGVTGTSNLANSLAVLTAAENRTPTTGGTTTTNQGGLITFNDRILGASNRNSTTDFAAPAIDVPTFNATASNFGGQQNIFTQGGTSMSSAIVTGAYAMVASALDYWTNLSMVGATTDAYLTQPVGARSLDFGHKSIANFRAYNNPTGINGILAYTAVPATDANDDLTTAGPPNLLGSTLYRSYARVDVGNAIASIEGSVALNYLFKTGAFSVIDANHNNLITSQEIQNFVDNANAMGLPEAGAMARLLGGTARSAINNDLTVNGDNPDQPDVLQRRFNYFDYASDGILNGAISIKQLKMLQKNLLPTADQYSITDRQRAAYNGFLIAPEAQRNFKNLRHISPKYQFVANSVVKKFRHVSPAQFGVNRGLKGFSSASPLFTLFDGPSKPTPASNNSSGSASGTSLAGTDAGTDTPTETGSNATSGTSSSTSTASNSAADGKKVADPKSNGSVVTADTPVVNQEADAKKSAEEAQQALLDAMKKLAEGGSTTPAATGDAASDGKKV